MQIRLLTTINYGNIGAYSDKMLHTPNPCTRLHAGLLQGGQLRQMDREVKEEGGVILVHSKGPFQEGCKGGVGGVWGWGLGSEPEYSSLCFLPPPQLSRLHRAGQGLPLHGNGGILGFFFFHVCFLVIAHPPEA